MRDLVKKVHHLQQGPNTKSSSKTVSYHKPKEISVTSVRRNTSNQDVKLAEDDDTHSEVDMDDFILQWSTIKKCASEQQMARSWAEADNRLMQIENYLTYIVTKLDNINKEITNINQGVTTI